MYADTGYGFRGILGFMGIQASQAGDHYDTNEAYSLLVDILGENQALTVAEAFSGTSIYIPKRIVTSRRYRLIRDEFRVGADYHSLAGKYGYTVNHIRKIVYQKPRRG